MYQKGIYYYGNKLFNSLLSHIKNLSDNSKQFKSTLKSFQFPNSLYSLDEYFHANNEWKFKDYPSTSFFITYCYFGIFFSTDWFESKDTQTFTCFLCF